MPTQSPHQTAVSRGEVTTPLHVTIVEAANPTAPLPLGRCGRSGPRTRSADSAASVGGLS
ncbi:hypothetical protein ACFC58_06325 [Kitasatospora purpeofusca]|uniref:hypothetical protein n=1 Tax=Kitasatospora purpeofusca TaxID=67352 RepID=UPI0035E0510C